MSGIQNLIVELIIGQIKSFIEIDLIKQKFEPLSRKEIAFFLEINKELIIKISNDIISNYDEKERIEIFEGDINNLLDKHFKLDRLNSIFNMLIVFSKTKVRIVKELEEFSIDFLTRDEFSNFVRENGVLIKYVAFKILQNSWNSNSLNPIYNSLIELGNRKLRVRIKNLIDRNIMYKYRNLGEDSEFYFDLFTCWNDELIENTISAIMNCYDSTLIKMSDFDLIFIVEKHIGHIIDLIPDFS